MSMQRENGFYCVKLDSDWGWEVAYYNASVIPGAPWWHNDCCHDESFFSQIGPRIRMPDELAPKPYGWACENRSPSGVLIGVRFVAGDIPQGRNRSERWFPVWRESGQSGGCQSALELALQVAGSSLDKHLSPADALNWLVEHHKAAQPVEYKGWYCAHCQRGVDGSEVTYNEQHQECGRVITDDGPPAAQPQVPEGYVLAPVEPLLEVLRISDRKHDAWDAIKAAITASQEQAVDTYGSREHECGSDT